MAVAQERRPDKQLYRITAEGEEALRAWVDSPVPISARNGLLLKLFFGAYADSASLREQVAERKRLAEQKLRELEEIERTIDTDEDFFPYLTLLHGLEDARSTVAWAKRTLQELDRHREREDARAEN